jgi:hypothetical protein
MESADDILARQVAIENARKATKELPKKQTVAKPASI